MPKKRPSTFDLAGIGETRSSASLQSLEPRILLDAAGAATAADAIDQVQDKSLERVVHAAVSGLEAAPWASQTALAEKALFDDHSDSKADRQIAFIDAAVEDKDALIASFADSIDVVILEADRDGVEQIAEVLNDRNSIDAVHIFSHGRSGTLDLGNTKLTEASMTNRHADEMTIIRGSLSESADILIYGCNFAANARGASAVEAFAQMTGADIAASEDLTGNTTLGGDWDLETVVGELNTQSMDVQNFQGVLDLSITAATNDTEVADIFVNNFVGSGIAATLTNILGDAGQYGTFVNDGTGLGPSILPIDDGVVFVTGDVNTAASPAGNTVDNTGFGGGITTGNPAADTDAELNTLAGGVGVYDVAGFDFNFQGTTNRIGFVFSFASDEYPEFVGTAFNDAFGFFIQGGADYTTQTNLAIVPDSAGTGIAVNTINSGVPGSAGGSASYPGADLTNSALYIDNSATDGGSTDPYLEYDGLTVQMTVEANITRNTNYSMKIGIADAGDYQWDSAVFFKTNGFIALTSASDNDYAVAQDAALSGNIITDDTGDDVDLDPESGTIGLVVTQVNGQASNVGSQIALPSGALLTVNSDGSYSYDQNGAFGSLGDGQSSVETFSYQITDDIGVTDSANVTITINGVNDAPVATPSISNGDEDTDIPVDLSGADIDGTVDFVTVTTLPPTIEGVLYLPGGLIPVTANTQISASDAANLIFTPALNFNGDVTIPFTVTDDDGLESASADEVITVNDVNDPPVATPSASSGDEDTDIPVDLSGTDVDGTVDFVTVTTLPPTIEGVLYLPGGLIPVTANTQISAADATNLIFTPALNFNGDVTIPFTVTDDDGLESASADEVITVNDVNDPPVATPSTSSGDEDTDLPVDLVGTDIDGTVDFVTVTTLPPTTEGVLYLPGGAVPVVAGAQISAADATNLIFTPALNFNGDVTIPFTVIDDDGLESAPANEVVTVNDVNDPPVATPSTSSGDEDTDLPVDLVGTDIDGTVDFVTVATLPPTTEGVLYLPGGTVPVVAGAQISAADAANLIFTPALNFNGDVTIPFTVTDDDGLESAPANEVVTVNAIPDVPVLDLDDDDSSTITGSGYEATFTEGDTGVAIADIDNLIVDVDSAQLNQARIRLTPIDPSDDLVVSGTLPAGITLTKQTLGNGDIRIVLNGAASLADYQAALAQIEFANSSLTPDAMDRKVIVDVRDVDGQRSNRATTTINVVEVLSPPVIVPDPSGNNTVGGKFQNSFTENDAPVSIVDIDATVTDQDSTEIGGATIVLTNTFPGDGVQVGTATRADGSPVPIGSTVTTLGNGNIQVTLIGASATPDDFARAIRAITYSTPSENPDPTTRVFEISLTDDSGATSVPVQTCVEVIPENDVPVLDLDTDDSSSVTGAGYQDEFVESSAGTPIADAGGNSIMDLDSPNMQSMDITLTNPEADDALFINPAYTPPAGLSVVLASDGLSVSITGDIAIADYQAALEAVRFVNSSENPVAGVREIDVQVSDGQDVSNVGTAEITVTPENDPPIPQDPANPGTPADAMPDQTGEDADGLTQFDVTPYFSDPDDAVLTYSLDPSNLPAWFTINASGEIIGTPPSDASQVSNIFGGAPGTYDIVVIATDPDGQTGETTIRYTITNPVPDAIDDNLDIDENDPDLSGSVFADNGNGPDVDADNDSFTVTEVNTDTGLVGNAVLGSDGGLFTINTDGSYTFADNGDFEFLALGEVQTTTVTYTTEDADGAADTATVTVTVTGTNDQPVSTGPMPDQAGIDSSAIADFDVTTFFDDPDGTDTLTFTVSPLALPPGLTFNGTSIVGAPNANASQFTNVPGGTPGVYIIPVVASDGNGGTITTNVQFTITNPPPVAQDDDLTIGEDDALITGSVYADNGNTIDEDPDGDAIEVVEVNGLPANLGQGIAGSDGGTFVINSDGSYEFDPGSDFQYLDDTESQTTSVTYQISDNEGGFSDATVTVTVNGANDAPVPVDPADPNGPADPNDYVPDQSGIDSQPLTPFDTSIFFGDPDTNDTLIFSSPDLPTWMTISSTGEINGTPPANASVGGPNGDGLYPITIEVTDGDQTFATTLDYTITNPPPVAQDDALTGGEDTVLAGTVFDPNGTATGDVDPDGDVIVVSQVDGDVANVGQPTAGSTGGLFTINPDGTYAFDPGDDFNGLGVGETRDTTITYQISDGEGGFDDATVTLTVEGANDAPIAVDPTQPPIDPDNPPAGVPFDPDTPFAPPVDPLNYIPVQDEATLGTPVEDGTAVPPLDLTPYFGDPDAPDAVTLSVVPADLPPGLTFDPVTGTLSGTPDPDASQGGDAGTPGTYTIPVTATDPSGETFTTNVTYVITNPPPVAQDDALTGDEDTVLAGTVFDPNGTATGDVDPDGDVIVVSQVDGDVANVGQPTAGSTGGLFTINPDGTYAFDPGDDFNGLGVGETRDTTITYQISDGEGGFDDATVTLTVEGANDAPIAVDPTRPPIDPDNPPAGVPFDPDTPFAPPVDPLNYIPVQDEATLGTPVEDGTAVPPLDLTPYFGDPDAPDAVTLSVVPADLPPGLTFDPVTGTLSGTPDPDASQGGDAGTPGTYTIPVTATDPSGETFTTNVTYVITNPPPVAQDDALTGDEDTVLAGTVFDPNGTATGDVDPDGDVIVVSQVDGDVANVGQPTAGSTGGLFTINPDGTYAFDPGDDFNGLGVGETRDTTITYQISDGEGGFDDATVTLTVEGANDAPIAVDPTRPPIDPDNPPAGVPFDPDTPFAPPVDPLNYIPVQDEATLGTPVEDGTAVPPLDLTPYFGDPDAPDAVTLSVVPADLPPGLTFDPVTGTLSGTPDPDASQGGDAGTPGTYTIPVTATDPSGETFTTNVTYVITNPPPVAQDDALTGDEDTVLAGTVFDPNGTATGDVDPDGDVIVVSQVDGDVANVGQPTAGSTGGLFTINPDGTYAFDPGDDFNGLGVGETRDTTITYQISDGEGGFDDATVTLTVEGANDAPIAVDPTRPPIDPDNPPAGVPFDPDTPFAPPVDPLNYIPVQDEATLGTPVEDGTAVPPLDLTPYFGDPDAPDAVTLSVVPADLPPGLTFDPVTGTLSGTPDPDASQGGDAGTPGTYTIPVTATDPSGETFTTNVTYVITNPPPVAQDDALTGDEDTVLAGTVFDPNGTATGDVDPDGDVIVVSQVDGDVANVGQPTAGSTGGLFTINPDGTYAFDPGDDFNGLGVGETRDTTITYQISDGEGGFDDATVTLTVEGANDAPIAVDPTQPPIDPDNPPAGVPFDPDTPFAPPVDPLNYIPVQDEATLGTPVEDGTAVPPLDLTPYFGDPDAPDAVTLSVVPADLPPGLTFDPVTGTLSGTPDPDASQGGDAGTPGTYTIPVTATDPSGETFTTNVTYVITNPPPVAQDDALTGDEDTVLAGTVFDPNGTATGDVDPDGDVIVVSQVDGDVANVGQPTAGSTGGLFTINPDGTYAFDPGDDFNGLGVGETRDTTITYQISDGEGGFDDATVTLTVEGANDAPIAVDPTQPPIDPDNPPAGVPFDPDTPFAPPVDPLNYIPVQDEATLGTPVEDGTAVPPLDLTPYFGDPDAPDAVTLSVVPADLPPGLTFDPVTGTLSGTPDPDASQGGDAGTPGTYTIPVTATDPSGETFTTNVTYVITNPPPVALVTIPDQAATNGFDVAMETALYFYIPDSDSLTYSAISLPPGLIIDTRTGLISGTLDGNASNGGPNADGLYPITVTVDDGQGGTASATFIFDANPTPFVATPEKPRTSLAPEDPGGPGFAPTGLTVDEAVNSFDNLGGNIELPSDLVVTEAVNAIRSLGGDTALNTNHPIMEAIRNMIETDRTTGDGSFLYPDGGEFKSDPYSGLQLGVKLRIADGQYVLRTVIWQGHTFVDIQTFGNTDISNWQLSMRNGQPLPSWITMPDGHVILIERVADVEHVHLLISGQLRSGSTVIFPVIIDLDSGEIVLQNEPLIDAKAAPGSAINFASSSSLNDEIHKTAFASSAAVSSLFSS